jgi:hypothetical protein
MTEPGAARPVAARPKRSVSSGIATASGGRRHQHPGADARISRPGAVGVEGRRLLSGAVVPSPAWEAVGPPATATRNLRGGANPPAATSRLDGVSQRNKGSTLGARPAASSPSGPAGRPARREGSGAFSSPGLGCRRSQPSAAGSAPAPLGLGRHGRRPAFSDHRRQSCRFPAVKSACRLRERVGRRPGR